ncbi:MAG: DUF6351 family protein [Caldimonas sp.]
MIEIAPPAGVALARIKVTLNGADVTSKLSTTDAATGGLRGLVDGLTTNAASTTGSANTLVVSNLDKPDQQTSLQLVNYPITGPILSGPHLTPYDCRTVQNGLGAALDADCTATTAFTYFYRTTANAFKPLPDPTGARPGDLVTTTTNDGTVVPYIVRVETGTVNRGIYRIAILDNPVAGATAYKPTAGWNRKLVAFFDCCGSAQYNQGVQPSGMVLDDRELRRGFAVMISTELFNNQHANPHLQGETLMMLKEYFIKHYGVPKWTAGMGGSGGAIQQYLIAQLNPGLLDGIQPNVSFPETLMPEVMECRLLNRYYATDTTTWTSARKVAVNGFNAGTCELWDAAFASIIKSDNVAGCGLDNPAQAYNALTNPTGVRCDIFQTNANLLGKNATTGFARRPIDNVGIQYGLGALKAGQITVDQFLDLNERIGGYDGDGNPQAARTVADPEALRLAYAGGLKNSFSGEGLANIPIITQRGNANEVGDIHDPLQDLIIRARLQKANGRSDNQIIWATGLTTPFDFGAYSIDTMNTWLDNMARDPAPPSTDKVVRNKPSGAVDSCWTLTGVRISEVASTDPASGCNVVYPRFSTPRIVAGGGMANDILKCQLKSTDVADYGAALSDVQRARLAAIFPAGVCDWSKPGVNQVPLQGHYLKLPLG